MADQKDSLRTYRSKRDSRRTPEPTGARKGRRGRRRHPMFVIQKHDASSLHYDFRLEADGVLKSWAVPKGPSTNPKDKRLAMPVEDHPLEYGDFEGVIPEGEYGAGTVLVWDTGTWRNLTSKDGEEVLVERALDQGHLHFELEGSKLQGPFALTRIGRGGRERWLLVKMAGKGADARRKPVRSEPDSVLSGRGLDEIAAQAEGGKGRRRRGQGSSR
jgi:DNA ligase D-like protein (predicted 3'-phosphoesterase)